MRDKLTWPVVAVVCSVIIASGIYLGLRDNRIQPTTQSAWWHDSPIVAEPEVRSFEEIVGEIPAPPVGFELDQQQPEAKRSDSVTSVKKVSTEENKSDPIVYATRTGECYHRGSCGYLRKSKIPMKLSQAKKRYRPCSKCSPPR